MRRGMKRVEMFTCCHELTCENGVGKKTDVELDGKFHGSSDGDGD